MICKTGGTMKNEAFSIWLIGPSASGKTTVSQKIYELLSPHHKNIILLDGDHARKIFVNESGYDPVSRSNNIKKYVGVVKWLNSFGISTIFAAINAFEKDRNYCREKINNYLEVFLKCSLEERIKRDKKKLYKPALSGEKKFVVDVDIPFEKPIKANLVVETEKDTPEKIAEKIIKGLNI